MPRRLHVCVTIALVAMVASPGAEAHGPCECTFPQVVEPGQKVRTGTAYMVIWNPAPRDFRKQTTPRDLASGYRSDAPTVTVLRRAPNKPLRRASFTVPHRTPPGLYFVLVFDGSEGGAHTTWDYLQVRGRPATRDGDGDANGDGAPIALVAAAAAGAAVLAAGVVFRRRRN